MIIIRVTLLVGVACFCGCESPCSNRVVSQKASPDGKHKFVIFSRECDATVRANLQASILKISEPLRSGGGNAVVVEGELFARWNKDGSLTFEIDKKSEIYKNCLSVDGVRVNYQFK